MAQSRVLPGRWHRAGNSTNAVPLERTVGPATRWAFYAWMFSLPFDVITPTWLPEEFQGYISIPRITGVVLTLCFLLDSKCLPWKLPPASAAFAAFFAILTFSMLRSDFTNVSVVFQQFQMLLVLLISYNLFSTGRITRGALLSFAVSCGIASLMLSTGWYAGVDDVYDAGGRLYTFGVSQNIYSKTLVVGVLVAIGLGHIRKERGVVNLPFVWAIALVNMAVIAKSGSRGMTLAVVVGLATFVLRKGSLWVRFRNLVLLAVVAGVASWILSHTVILVDRWTQTLESGDTAGREMIFKEAFHMIMEKPLIGWGPSATRVLAERVNFKGEVRATHNMVLAILTFNGVVGFLPYCWVYWTLVRSTWRSRSGVENVLPLAIFAAVFVGDMASGGLPDKVHWTFFAYQLATGTIAGSTVGWRRARPVTLFASHNQEGT